MHRFQVHTMQSAPAGSAAALEALEGALGFIPNLAATMAESPALVGGFVELRGTLARSGLSGAEREIVAIAVSRENGCDYCVAAHSTFALMHRADEDAVAAARDGDGPEDPRLAALYRFARALVETRGHVGDDDVQAVLDAGHPPSALFDVIAQIGHTTLANLAHNMTGVSLDDAFRPQAWTRAAA